MKSKIILIGLGNTGKLAKTLPVLNHSILPINNANDNDGWVFKNKPLPIKFKPFPIEKLKIFKDDK